MQTIVEEASALWLALDSVKVVVGTGVQGGKLGLRRSAQAQACRGMHGGLGDDARRGQTSAVDGNRYPGKP
jgi:hypothetical protein